MSEKVDTSLEAIGRLIVKLDHRGMETYSDALRALLAERGALLAANESLAKDAERYRWLRSKAHSEQAYDRYPGNHWFIGFYDDNKIGFDAAIDAALAASASAKERTP